MHRIKHHLQFLLAALLVFTTVPARVNAVEALRDKTLVAWVSPANLTQRGGSVLTLEKPGGVFDAIVFGEIAPSKWMAGSDGFRRTKREQEGFPGEIAGRDATIQIAVVYQERQITLYRNGTQFATYTIEGAERFGDDSKV